MLPITGQEQVLARLHRVAELEEHLPVALEEVLVVAVESDIPLEDLPCAPELACGDGCIGSLVEIRVAPPHG
ncbi:MAG TPA: hypothetical protein PLE19_18280 [Planctomycetota bacterium]|nr:hypothetical protein [Planctomycetota bacterium]HRR81796.1 hypothetical protein [Planctomycetota bacterium]HRT94061.1 hypothetical protein [Planctomycetota bacterium]